MKKIIASTFILASVCGVFGAGEIWAENTTTHAVQKGDTLWDLSGGYLNNPLLWPKIWKLNPGIANPNLILPGQIVTIPGGGKSPAPEAPAEMVVGPVASGSSPLAKAGLASTSEPLSLIVVKKELAGNGAQAAAGLGNVPARYYEQGVGMLTNDIPKVGKVLQTEGGWKVAALGETILISAPGAQVGQQFGVYRDMGKVESLSYFGASPGHLLAEIGILEVVASDPVRQQAVIRRAFGEVKRGDLLGQVPEVPTVSEIPVQGGPPSVKGAVVAFHMMRQLAGPGDIIYLNVGTDQGLAPGHLLSVAAADQAEGRTSGEILVLRVSAKSAAAVVTKRSGHEVRRGDLVGPPAL
ncbi:LysM peptidoglycan-binding domain-containing protein [Thiovibrio frasassiensis]|uniref:LysM peptidoglycan-binding domain-containing protein n=1 Tax=Thiovibrio frasassiensis TaxID=2984131 RepID=A0A9X4MJY6_9BACT|nr:LysM domain-containing protein [Thiovibrio frasassiensis]MDG4476908.1 LysM peptidoglycan-binding domain-containing protein [Thiovibrio frasassiensis]